MGGEKWEGGGGGRRGTNVGVGVGGGEKYGKRGRDCIFMNYSECDGTVVQNICGTPVEYTVY